MGREDELLPFFQMIQHKCEDTVLNICLNIREVFVAVVEAHWAGKNGCKENRNVNTLCYAAGKDLSIQELIYLQLAIEVAEYFGLTEKEVLKISADICETVKQKWIKLAEWYGLSRGAIEYMRPAFSLEL